MIKLLIAEDEHLERRAIKFYLEKNYEQKIEVAAEVSNGKEAVSKSLEKDVDLILMDIKMPKMNGLEAARKLKEKNQDFEIIILTAHSEFDYAQKAIKVGVNDYLVKPYVEEDFIEVIDSAVEKIEARKKNKLKEKKLVERIKNLTPILEKEILLNIIYDTESSQQKFLRHKKLLGITDQKYMFITIKYDDRSKIEKSLYKFTKDKLNTIFNGVISYNGLINSIFLLIDDQLESKIDTDEVKKLKKLIKKRAEADSKKIKINKSSISDDFEEISKIYTESKDKINDDKFSINNYPYESEKKVFSKIIDREKEQALKEFEKIFDYLLKEQRNNLKKIKSFLRRFLVFLNRRLMEYYNKEQEFLEIHNLENELTLIDNLEGLKEYFEKIISDLIDDLSHDANDQKVEIIEMVKEYIKDNYDEDISLEDVADYISFSKYYLSKLFKEVEGINYKDYLIKVRMEEAKKRLKKGKKIKVVASEVGYSDRNYFSRAFKKYTGISPGKYQ